MDIFLKSWWILSWFCCCLSLYFYNAKIGIKLLHTLRINKGINDWVKISWLSENRNQKTTNHFSLPPLWVRENQTHLYFLKMICSLDKCDRWLGRRIIVLRFCKNYFLSAIFDAKGRKSFQRHNPLKLIGCKNFRDAGFEDGEIPTKKWKLIPSHFLVGIFAFCHLQHQQKRPPCTNCTIITDLTCVCLKRFSNIFPRRPN